MKAIIVDDEYNSYITLEALIKEEFAKEIEILGYCDSVKTAYQAITELQPDFIFLDIHLGEETGFDLLQLFAGNHPYVVFLTDHKKYALDAFPFDPVNFLGKPPLSKKMQETIDLLKKRMGQGKRNIKKTKEKFVVAKSGCIKRLLKSGIYVKPEEVICCDSEKNTTILFYLSKDQTIESHHDVSWNLGKYQTYFEADHFDFQRIHRKHLINPAFITKIDQQNHMVVLCDKIIRKIAKD
ncbi:LytR/AlgR family response regulator transcription factor [Flavobacterium sp.]|uniref:LytR/AlgR family response regulator transcription factor n=1 Tax=Flavobacterium sp. TaxID=239 RepID=UPI0039E2F6D0